MAGFYPAEEADTQHVRGTGFRCGYLATQNVRFGGFRLRLELVGYPEAFCCHNRYHDYVLCGRLAGLGVWKGVLVQDLLQQAGLHPNAAYLNFECVDGFKSVISLSYAQKYDAMLAYEVNGEPLQDHDGFPLRLIAFGKYGYKWAKWVNKIYVLSFNQVASWPSDDWLDPGDVPVEWRRPFEGEDVEPLEY
ncbi:MAG: molybdopterin-dependent oxidoreductase [candidate division KSB1 bacterium]|nr:molybdopterin-dependent oxidoreductase [candidate division KSB1 bacterium]